MQYIPRNIENNIKKLIKGFPVIVITGPRQSGKTTVLKQMFPDYKYFNLELPTTLETIKSDPLRFLRDNPRKVIIDEVQKFPELLSYIQVHVDGTQEMGSIFLTGSQNLLVSEKISQSLAGRAAYQTLLSLSQEELSNADIRFEKTDDFIMKGGYPSLYVREIDESLYFQQYIATYLERDVREIKAVQDLLLFQKFMSLLAGRVGQLISESSLANDVGVSPNTISSWISVLEASYIIFRLQPYFKNHSKRLIKSPKVYFNDTGLLCNLLRIKTIEELSQHYAYGSIFENAVISEIRKIELTSSTPDDLYFYRDSNNNEIDLLIDKGTKIIPVEIKSALTYNNSFSKGLEYWRKHFQDIDGYIVYGAEEKVKMNKDTVIGFKNVKDILSDKHS